MIVASDIIASIANDLSRSKEAKRAKKLVFYISQRYWESDFSIIDGYSFEALLQCLYENNPTIEDLKALLYHAVNTLNRKTVYTKIAKYILQKMSDLYDTSLDKSLDDLTNQANQFEPELIDRIVENIFAHEESVRIRKLIFAACKQYWENDINVIEMYELRELLLELRQLYPNTKRLRKALDNVIATINRQNFYSFIADTIVGELAYLYQYDAIETNNYREGGDEEDTQLIKAKRARESTSANQAELTPDQAIIGAHNSVAQEEKAVLEEKVEVVQGNVSEGQVIPWLKADNLFELKQEIMQYTNPLRAKVMLFYAIYQIDTSEQHWSIVRTCTLDDLLIRMFQHHGKDLDKIESQLMDIANCSIEGLEPEDNIQAVSAIIESIRHFYQKR